MPSIPAKLKNLGFKTQFLDQVDAAKLIDHAVARVTAVNKDSYTIDKGNGDVPAEVTGKLMYSVESPMDLPATGDWVIARFYDNDALAIISEVLPRASVLKRKSAGKKVEFQLIAANIDTAFIVQSLDGNYNLRRLERYLVMINASHIQPVVLLSKSDLLSLDEINKKVADINDLSQDTGVVAFSNIDQAGLKSVKNLLLPGKTYCLLGSSGVGKTSLINNLLEERRFKTRNVRAKDSKGRHITTRRQLICLDNGAMIIDTPGMRELGNFDIRTGIQSTFVEIDALSGQCHFNDCTHTQEDGCAILAAVETGRISNERYQNFMKLNRESAFYEMSYLEKKQKDKAFGKLVKSVMKHKKNRR